MLCYVEYTLLAGLFVVFVESLSEERPGTIMAQPNEIYQGDQRVYPQYPDPPRPIGELADISTYWDKILAETLQHIRTALRYQDQSELELRSRDLCRSCELVHYKNVYLARADLPKVQLKNATNSTVWSLIANFERYGALCQCDKEQLREAGLNTTSDQLRTDWISSQLNLTITKEVIQPAHKDLNATKRYTTGCAYTSYNYEADTFYPSPSKNQTWLGIRKDHQTVKDLQAELREAICTFVQTKMSCVVTYINAREQNITSERCLSAVEAHRSSGVANEISRVAIGSLFGILILTRAVLG